MDKSRWLVMQTATAAWFHADHKEWQKQRQGSIRLHAPPPLRPFALFWAFTEFDRSVKPIKSPSRVGGRIKTSQLGSNQNQPLFFYKPV
jgi:hypothetical protein